MTPAAVLTANKKMARLVLDNGLAVEGVVEQCDEFYNTVAVIDTEVGTLSLVDCAAVVVVEINLKDR